MALSVLGKWHNPELLELSFSFSSPSLLFFFFLFPVKIKKLSHTFLIMRIWTRFNLNFENIFQLKTLIDSWLSSHLIAMCIQWSQAPFSLVISRLQSRWHHSPEGQPLLDCCFLNIFCKVFVRGDFSFFELAADLLWLCQTWCLPL